MVMGSQLPQKDSDKCAMLFPKASSDVSLTPLVKVTAVLHAGTHRKEGRAGCLSAGEGISLPY